MQPGTAGGLSGQRPEIFQLALRDDFLLDALCIAIEAGINGEWHPTTKPAADLWDEKSWNDALGSMGARLDRDGSRAGIMEGPPLKDGVLWVTVKDWELFFEETTHFDVEFVAKFKPPSPAPPPASRSRPRRFWRPPLALPI